MIRLSLIIIACLLAPNMDDVADYYWPVDSPLYNNQWDIVKHVVYLSLASTLALKSILPKSDRRLKFSGVYFLYEDFTRLFSYTLFLGELLPMICDKGNRYAGTQWYDCVFIAAAMYSGMKNLTPVIHEQIGCFFVGRRIYSSLMGISLWLKK